MAAKDEGTRARRGTPPVTQDDTPTGTGGRRTRRQTRRPDTPEPTAQATAEQATAEQAAAEQAMTTPATEAAPAPPATKRAPRGDRSARTAAVPHGRHRPGDGTASSAVRGEVAPGASGPAASEPATAAVIEDEMTPAEAAAETGEAPSATAGEAAGPRTEETPESAAVPALAAEQTQTIGPAHELEASPIEGGETSADEEPSTVQEPGEHYSAAGDEQPRRDRHRVSHSNALGTLIERHFGDPASPCRSYSDLERHSGISREALSRYVTARRDRRRSPTIDTLVAIGDAMHLSLESVARAAAASVKGVQLPPEQEQAEREEVLGTLVAALTAEQFGAVVELLRQLRPAPGAS